MKYRTLAALALVWFLSVQPALAQFGDGSISGTTIPEYLRSITGFIYIVLVPLLFAVAFIAFLYGIFLYFIAGGADEEKRSQGKQLAIWGIVGFFVMVSVWGLVNIIRNTFNIDAINNAPSIPTFPTGSGT